VVVAGGGMGWMERPEIDGLGVWRADGRSVGGLDGRVYLGACALGLHVLLFGSSAGLLWHALLLSLSLWVVLSCFFSPPLSPLLELPLALSPTHRPAQCGRYPLTTSGCHSVGTFSPPLLHSVRLELLDHNLVRYWHHFSLFPFTPRLWGSFLFLFLSPSELADIGHATRRIGNLS
jgi:hypothetical protein